MQNYNTAGMRGSRCAGRPMHVPSAHDSCSARQESCPPACSIRQDAVSPDGHSRDAFAGFPIAMAYVPWQHYSSVFELDKALRVGTIFPELDKPFLAKRGCRA